MLSPALADLLVHSAGLLEDWDVAVKQGSRDLSMLLDQLPRLARDGASRRAVADLLDKAGCTTLVTAMHDSPYRHNDVGLAGELQAAYLGLQEALHLAQSTCLSLEQLAADARQAPSAQPAVRFTTAPTPPAADSEEDDNQVGSVSEDAAKEDGAAPVSMLTDEEAKLLLLIVLKQLQKQLEVMELIAGAVKLTTPEGELYTYATMWDLQPFVDDRALQCIQQLVGELARDEHAAKSAALQAS